MYTILKVQRIHDMPGTPDRRPRWILYDKRAGGRHTAPHAPRRTAHTGVECGALDVDLEPPVAACAALRTPVLLRRVRTRRARRDPSNQVFSLLINVKCGIIERRRRNSSFAWSRPVHGQVMSHISLAVVSLLGVSG